MDILGQTTAEFCKTQFERKHTRGEITHDYVLKQKRYIKLFLMNDEITETEYQELFDLLTGYDPEPETKTE